MIRKLPVPPLCDRSMIATLLLFTPLLVQGCGEGEPTGPTNEPVPAAGVVFRPADHMPPYVRKTPIHPVPPEVDGFPCIDIYVGAQRVGRITPDDLEAAKWTNSDPGKDLAGASIPYRTAVDLEKLTDLVEFLRRAGVDAPESVEVMTLGPGVEIPRRMLQDGDHRFYFLFNRRKMVKFFMRKNMKDGPNGSDRWVMFSLLKGAAWVILPEARSSSD